MHLMHLYGDGLLAPADQAAWRITGVPPVSPDSKRSSGVPPVGESHGRDALATVLAEFERAQVIAIRNQRGQVQDTHPSNGMDGCPRIWLPPGDVVKSVKLRSDFDQLNKVPLGDSYRHG